VEKKERQQVALKIPLTLTRHELGIEGTMDFDLIITGGIIVRVLYTIKTSTHDSNMYTGHSQRSLT
jgi:hypothetical protein